MTDLNDVHDNHVFGEDDAVIAGAKTEGRRSPKRLHVASPRQRVLFDLRFNTNRHLRRLLSQKLIGLAVYVIVFMFTCSILLRRVQEW